MRCSSLVSVLPQVFARPSTDSPVPLSYRAARTERRSSDAWGRATPRPAVRHHSGAPGDSSVANGRSIPGAAPESGTLASPRPGPEFRVADRNPPGYHPQPDLILHNGQILTLDRASSTVQALAIKGDRIVAAGADDAVLGTAGGRTRRLDLGGRTVVPGFCA